MFSFIETQLFTRLVKQYLSDEQYAELQMALMANPELAPVIAGTGGVRKLAGPLRVAASVAVTASSITYAAQKA